MEALRWIGGQWFELLQTVGIILGLAFTAYTIRKGEQATKISNLLAIKQEYREIWSRLFEKNTLSRVLAPTVDLNRVPISSEESLFVKLLILHLDSVHRAIRAGTFVKLEGLDSDIKKFFSAPIPKAIWGSMRSFQDKDFVTFIENLLA